MSTNRELTQELLRGSQLPFALFGLMPKLLELFGETSRFRVICRSVASFVNKFAINTCQVNQRALSLVLREILFTDMSPTAATLLTLITTVRFVLLDSLVRDNLE